jgi:hypothetical protein
MGLGQRDPLKTMDNVLDQPYDSAMSDWKAQLDPLEKAAQLENTANANERYLRTSVLSNKYNTDKLAENTRLAEEKNRITEKNNDARNAASMLRAQAAQMKANGYTFDTKGPTIIAHRPDGTIFDTGVETGMMNQLDLENLRGKYKVSAAAQAGANQINRIKAMGGNMFQDEDGNIYDANPQGGVTPVGNAPEQPKGKLTRPTGGGKGAGTKSAAVLETERQDKMRKIFMENPDLQPAFAATKDAKGVVHYELKKRPTGETWGLATKAAREEQANWDKASQMITGDAPNVGKQETGREYSKSKNQTRITYSDGTTAIVDGYQEK